MSRLRLALLLALAGVTACADSVINDIEPVNNQTVTSVPDSFTYIATDLENVTDRVTFAWNNPQPRAQTFHQSFLPHGYGLLVILDAVGAVVDSTLLEYDLVTESEAGVPGLWTVIIIYSNAWGRGQISLTPLPAVPASARPAAAPAVESSAADRRPRRQAGGQEGSQR